MRQNTCGYYCWWLKSCTTWHVWNPVASAIKLPTSTGDRRISEPSTVAWPSHGDSYFPRNVGDLDGWRLVLGSGLQTFSAGPGRMGRREGSGKWLQVSNQVCPGGFGGVVDSNHAILRRFSRTFNTFFGWIFKVRAVEKTTPLVLPTPQFLRNL